MLVSLPNIKAVATINGVVISTVLDSTLSNSLLL